MSNPSFDPVSDRPALYLPTRLKRIAERMQIQSLRLLKEHHSFINPSNATLFAHLFDGGRQTVGQLATALSVTQPTITVAVGKLVEAGLANVKNDSLDQRLRVVELTEQGRNAWIAGEVQIFGKLNAILESMVQDFRHDLFHSLDLLESEVKAKPLDARAREVVTKGYKLRDFCSTDAAEFLELNMAYLKEHGLLLDSDLNRLVSTPSSVLANGGDLILAEAHDVGIVGSCGLNKVNDTTYEVVCLTVAQPARKAGIGTALLSSIIERSQSKRARLVYLLTNEKLVPAQALFRKLGFSRDAKAFKTFGRRDTRAGLAYSLAPM